MPKRFVTPQLADLRQDQRNLLLILLLGLPVGVWLDLSALSDTALRRQALGDGLLVGAHRLAGTDADRRRSARRAQGDQRSWRAAAGVSNYPEGR
jgi:hypothetical protein